MLARAGDSHAGLSSASRAGLSSAGWYPCAARAAPHLVLLQPRDVLLHQAQLPVVQPLGAQRGQRRCEGARECPGHAGGSGVSHGVRRAGPRPVLEDRGSRSRQPTPHLCPASRARAAGPAPAAAPPWPVAAPASSSAAPRSARERRGQRGQWAVRGLIVGGSGGSPEGAIATAPKRHLQRSPPAAWLWHPPGRRPPPGRAQACRRRTALAWGLSRDLGC